MPCYLLYDSVDLSEAIIFEDPRREDRGTGIANQGGSVYALLARLLAAIYEYITMIIFLCYTRPT